MRKFVARIFVTLLLLSASVHAHDVFEQELRIQDRLNFLFDKSFAPERVLVEVVAVYETKHSEVVTEKEVIRSDSGKESQPVELLPGFTPANIEEAEPKISNYVKEKLKGNEKDEVKKIAVQIFYDKAFSPEEVSELKSVAQSYMSSQVNVTYTLGFTPIFVKPPVEFDVMVYATQNWQTWAAIGVLAFVALLVLLFLVKLFFRKPKKVSTPIERAELAAPQKVEGSAEKTADQSLAALFLNNITQNTEPFRLYFEQLPLAKRAALAAKLEGPAFSSILSTLDLEQPESTVGADEEEHDLAFFMREFSNFVQAFSWQSRQFFGFLGQMDAAEIVTLFRDIEPLSSAVVLRFLAAEQRSNVLAALQPDLRLEIMRQFSNTAALSMERVAEIEEKIKTHLKKIPRIGDQLLKNDLDFWTDLFLKSEDQDSILADIKTALPEIYPHIAKLQFKLEDIPTLPTEVISKVVGELDNTQLALALLDMPQSLVDLLVQNVSEQRRQLVLSQMRTLTESSPEEIKQAKK